MEDVLYRGQVEQDKIAFTFARSTHVVTEAVLAHDSDPVAAHVLGRALTAGLLLTPQLAKPGDRVNVVWRYGGGLRSVVVDAGGDGTVRGLVSPRHLAGVGEHLDDLYGEGAGMLKLIRSRGTEFLTSGSVKARMQDVVGDLEFGLCVSDQVESGACVLIGFAPNAESPIAICQGLLLQAMPEAKPERFETCRNRLQSEELRSLLAHPLEVERDFEAVVQAFTGHAAPAFTLEACSPPIWQCNCTEEKMRAVLTTLPAEDRADILAKGETLNIRCEFCNRVFEISPELAQSVWSTSARGS